MKIYNILIYFLRSERNDQRFFRWLRNDQKMWVRNDLQTRVPKGKGTKLLASLSQGNSIYWFPIRTILLLQSRLFSCIHLGPY